MSGTVARGRAGYQFDGRLNESMKALNLLLDKGVKVQRVKPSGDFVLSDAPREVLTAAARQTGVDFTPLESAANATDVHRLRIGIYQRYRGGSTDEGWTRWLLEQYGFPYTTVRDAEIKKPGLPYDLVILPNDSPASLLGPSAADTLADEPWPPEYRSGLGNEGVAALKAFVQKGGTLLTLGDASSFAIEKLGLAIRNVTAGRSPKEFWCPGSTLEVKVETGHPLAYGMPGNAIATYLGGNPAFEILPSQHNERYETIVRYADRDLLESGWLTGEQVLAKKAAMVRAQYGSGSVILIGFRAQHRAQTHGTFKLLFNALLRW
jgi:hypothetical protein